MTAVANGSKSVEVVLWPRVYRRYWNWQQLQWNALKQDQQVKILETRRL